MKIVRKSLVLLVFLISMIGCIVSASYLIVNVQEIPGKILQNREMRDHETPTISVDNRNIVAKYLLVLRKISIDLSAVTPLLLLWFCFSLFWFSGKYLMLKGWTADKIPNPETFPFYREYETTWVQLGFIGTLWGFLIIGWNMGLTDQNVPIQVDILKILMRAFGTALLSTFSAVVLVYLITPPVKSFFRWAMEIPGENTALVANEVARYFQELSQEIQRSALVVNTFNTRIESVANIIPNVPLQEIAHMIATLNNKINATTEGTLKHHEVIISALNQINRNVESLAVTIKEQNEGLLGSLDKIGHNIHTQTTQLSQKLTMVETAIKEEGKVFQENLETAKKEVQTQALQVRRQLNMVYKQNKEQQTAFSVLQTTIQNIYGQVDRLVTRFFQIFREE